MVWSDFDVLVPPKIVHLFSKHIMSSFCGSSTLLLAYGGKNLNDKRIPIKQERLDINILSHPYESLLQQKQEK